MKRKYSTPYRTQTGGLLFRRQLLWIPTELKAYMVPPTRIELVTPGSSGQRSTYWATEAFGTHYRIRTCDLLFRRQPLCSNWAKCAYGDCGWNRTIIPEVAAQSLNRLATQSIIKTSHLIISKKYCYNIIFYNYFRCLLASAKRFELLSLAPETRVLPLDEAEI